MIVIFDTNGYRNFVIDKEVSDIKVEMVDLRKKEQSKGIIPFMCTTVAMELLKHLLDDESQKSFESCLKASQAMYYHCGDAESFRLLSLPEVQIAKEYFNVENLRSIETQKSVGHILYQISQSPAIETVNKNKESIIKIRDFIHLAEETLVREVKEFIKNVDPTAMNWNLYANDKKKKGDYLKYIRSEDFEKNTAQAMLWAVAIDLCSKGYLSIENVRVDILNKVKAYITSYKTSLVFRKKWWEYLANINFDLKNKSRANFLWDEHILHFVNKTVAGEQTLLVTSDKKMKEAAKEVNSDSLVFTYKEYIDFLNQ